MIILEPSMDIDPQSIINNLRKREKLYLKIMLKMKKNTSQQQRQMDLARSLSTVSTDLESGQISFLELEEIVPSFSEDKKKFA
jgi:hypothetical protein